MAVRVESAVGAAMVTEQSQSRSTGKTSIVNGEVGESTRYGTHEFAILLSAVRNDCGQVKWRIPKFISSSVVGCVPCGPCRRGPLAKTKSRPATLRNIQDFSGDALGHRPLRTISKCRVIAATPNTVIQQDTYLIPVYCTQGFGQSCTKSPSYG